MTMEVTSSAQMSGSASSPSSSTSTSTSTPNASPQKQKKISKKINIDILMKKWKKSKSNQSSSSTSNSQPVKRSWRSSRPFIMAVVYLGILCDMMVYGIVIPILPFIVRDLGGSTSEVGMLVAIYGVGLIVAAPLFGIVADKWQNKKTPMMTGLFILLVSTMLFALARARWVLILARFLQGVAAAAVWTLGLALVAEAFYGEVASLGKGMGAVLSAYTLGQLIGPPIGGLLYTYNKLYPFIFCSAIVVIDFIGRSLVIEPPRDKPTAGEVLSLTTIPVSESAMSTNLTATSSPPKPSTTGITRQDSNDTVMNVDVIESEEAQQGRFSNSNEDLANTGTAATSSNSIGFLQLLKSPPLLILCALIATVGAILSGIEPTLPIWLESEYNADPTHVGLIFMALVIPTVVMGPIGGAIYDRFGATRVLTVGFILGMVITPMLSIGGNIVWTCIGLFVFGCVFAVAMAPIMPEIAGCVERESYSKAYSLFNIAWSSGLVVGPTAGSVVFQYVGWRWQLICFSGLLLLAFPLIYVYKRPKGSDSEDVDVGNEDEL
ncbi:hypothetical protein HDU76_002063 [Blyttiomyces sp. JEL0837]|nr:hypothetical protein HDU76_002063 [Blyttiomyces sp. JEL0837]